MTTRGIDSLSVVFIGAGGVAVNLARAMRNKGIKITQIFSRTKEAAYSLAQIVQADYTDNLMKITLNADIYIVALTDAALAQLVPQITQGKGQALFLHTAGSISIDIWQGYAKRYGVLYPMQTFSKQRQVDISQVPFFVEANSEQDLALLHDFVGLLSDKIYQINSKQRLSLHVAAVFAANFTNYLYGLAADLLSNNNIPFQVMWPLIDETARKIHYLTPYMAQTGPAVRHDTNVLDKHLAFLENEPQMCQVYRLISEQIYEHHKL